MKILFTNFHGTNGGGHVTYILSLAKALSAAHQVSVATPASSRLYRYARQIPGLNVVDQRYTSRISHMVPEVRQLRRLLKEERYELIHVNGSADHRHVMFAIRGMVKPPRVVWTKHNDHPVSSFGHWLRARWATNHVIAVSSYILGMLERSHYASLPHSTIRHGVDTGRFSPATKTEKDQQRRAIFGDNHSELVVFGSSGGTDYDKGWLDLLAAIALLPQELKRRCRVIVAGAPLKQDKIDRVNQLGASELTFFPGLIDDVRPLFAACDVGFVLSYREALSYACREAMSSGLPTIVSSVGGLPENITNGVDGWIVPPKSPNAIAKVLTAILSDPELVKRMSAAARQKSETEFSLPPFVEKTLSVYEMTLARSEH